MPQFHPRLASAELDHVDVLNRYSDLQNEEQTIQIMRYLFPRQFGLHNVFTSTVDARESSMPFKDYTLREKDIHNHLCQKFGNNANNAQERRKYMSHTPKRLRGAATALVKKMRVLHQRCSFMELLRHYCPVEVIACTLTVGIAGLTGVGSTFVAKTRMETLHTSTSNQYRSKYSCVTSQH